MLMRILKKDLKRKKTMNIILLLFVIMCSMFAAASANNIIAVTGGIDKYFDDAGVPDVNVTYQFFRGQPEPDIEDRLKALDSVKSVEPMHALFILSSKHFILHGKQLQNFYNPAAIVSDTEMRIKYYDEQNNVIKGVEKGCFYATKPFVQGGIDIKEGDIVGVKLGENTYDLKYAGRFKGALFSSNDSSNPVILVNQEDYAVLDKEEEAHLIDYTDLHIKCTEPDEIRSIVKEYDSTSISTREESKSIYLYDMMAAYIMMAISVILMITAFVVLRFTIGFTISEEFREIGVMKAVGISNGSIRSLYIVKYLAIAVVGSAVGFLCSIPLGDMMMKTVSENMVLAADNSSILGLVSSASVVALIMLFCYGCTRKVNKLSPLDAVRSGQTGERFGKKSVLHLGRSKLPSTGFMALNDVLSAPRQFCIITVIFTLCILMITMMSNMALTLKSEKIRWLFDIPQSEAHIIDTEYWGEVMGDQKKAYDIIDKTEKLLTDNDMPAKCTMMLSNPFEATHGSIKANINFAVTRGHTDDVRRVEEGYAPRKDNEIMMTSGALEDLNAKIGDTITADLGGKQYEFIITGRYASFMGHTATLNNNFDIGSVTANGTTGLQIHFDGNPDNATIEKNIEKIRDLIGSTKVYNTSDMIKQFTSVSDMLNSIKYMMLILTAIVTAMIVILMERSFISKEKSEIALMEAVGISQGSIIGQHVIRLLIAALIAVGVASGTVMPISNVIMNKICTLIGDVSGIKCDFDAIEIFAVCPAIVIGITVIGTFLTSLYTKTIKASDTSSIE